MSTAMFDLSAEVAMVIGGTGALGGAIASALAGAGAKVAVCGRNAERGRARVDAIVEAGGTADFFFVDASDRAGLREADAAIAAAFGPVSILVNGSGGNDPKVTATPDNPVTEIPTEAWMESLNLNFLGGALIPSQEIGRGMCARRRGSIINIASVSAHLPLSRVVAYSAAKAAVVNLTQFLAREWAPFGVRVNSLTPGFFPAEQNRRLLFHEDGTPTARAQSILGHTPMGRFGQADELGGAAIFLASPRASGFVTGTDLCVDGGFLAQTI